MGSRLARRLHASGYETAVYDRDRSKAEALLPHGISVAENLTDLAAKSDVIVSSLTDDEAVRNAYLAPDGAIAGARSGMVVLEMSTISPGTSRELHAMGAHRGVKVMDVAISGSTLAVEKGTITLLAGGDAELFRAAEPIFRAISAQ
jgi:3-hydroxyisobutyrate dehydrogenase-like beta-hydroxyacid dehydrogenase